MPFPDKLLTDVYWSLAEPVPATPLDLFEEARKYAAELGAPDPSSMLRASLPLADLVVRCRWDVRNEHGEWIKASRQHRVVGVPGQLTGADLLWEVHVAFAGEVGPSDQHFFEGFERVSDGDAPLYELVLGS